MTTTTTAIERESGHDVEIECRDDREATGLYLSLISQGRVARMSHDKHGTPIVAMAEDTYIRLCWSEFRARI